MDEKVQEQVGICTLFLCHMPHAGQAVGEMSRVQRGLLNPGPTVELLGRHFKIPGAQSPPIKSEPGVRDPTCAGIIKAPLEILITVKVANH